MLADLIEDLTDPENLQKVLDEVVFQNPSERRYKIKVKSVKRLDKKATKILQAKFDKSAIWSKAEIAKLAKKVGVSCRKIYKWNWDKKKAT